MSRDRPKVSCAVCEALTPLQLAELDSLMADPTRWPVTVWGMFDPPKGMPASYRRFGAMEMGTGFLRDNGHGDIPNRELRRHYRFDVPKIAVDPDDLVATGLIASTRDTSLIPDAAIDPVAYLRYYAKGIEVGIEGLRLLADRVQDLQSRKQEVPIALIKMMMENGTKLAMSQASIRAAGKSWGSDENVEDAFRDASAPVPSPRFGDQRVRVIDGEARPIVDRGPADREHYSERARAEGGEGLPHR